MSKNLKKTIIHKDRYECRNIIDKNNFTDELYCKRLFKTVDDSIPLQERILKEKQNRINLVKKMHGTYKFDNKVFMIGFGCVGRPLLYMIHKVCNLDLSKVIIIDKNDKQNDINEIFGKNNNITFIKAIVEKSNYKQLFKDVDNDDLIIDVAYYINTLDMLKLCNDKGAIYINSCIDGWKPDLTNAIKYSIYDTHKELEKWNDSLKNKNFNAIISMGCNPGCVSSWVKLGLEMINKDSKNFKYESFGDLSNKLGVQVIHISERDTQRTLIGKNQNEYCNTWSSDGEAYYEEALGCSEISKGTHEPHIMDEIDHPNKNEFCIIDKMGLHTYCQSIVPIYNEFIGNVVRHDESFSIGKSLEVKNKNGQIIYRPSVYYVYHPCNDAMMSIQELKDKRYQYQDNYRLLTNEIVDGRDILGLTYYLKNGDVYWIGSTLDINEARDLFDNKFNKFINATNIQVIAGYLSGILFLLELLNKNIKVGLMMPDDLPYKFMISKQMPFLGDFIFCKMNYELMKYSSNFTVKDFDTKKWTFENFIIH